MSAVSDMQQVHEWFLHRGLPLVLTRRVRSRDLIKRSAPMVSGVGALTATTMLLAELTSEGPDYGYALRLGVIGAALLAAPFALHLLHRTGTRLGEAGRRSAAALVIAIFVIVMPITVSGWSSAAAAEAPIFVAITLLAIWLTYLGFGSIAGWAFRFAWVQLGALGTLMSRALPLLMLTVVVFFTGELWQLAARMTRQRLWQVIGFLALVALLFVIATIRDEVRALRDDRAGPRDPRELLAGTPLADGIDHDPARTPLSRAEQFNVVAVMVVSQAIQVAFFTAGLFAFFLALGVIAIPDDVAVLWSSEETCAVGQPPCAGTWFGIHIPIPQTIVHTSLFVAVLSGLYFTVSTSVDPLYRQRFFEPLIADVAVSLAGRDAYLEMECEPDPGHDLTRQPRHQ
ncbi:MULTISPECIES: energy-coupling factor transporter transmembrane protein EcfT [unclassified Mycolicibacterium]|uniref:energy-coupling factor transporter transmembrane protein EcfT n=1 Tax=unclassified Mycolicibacterium TaxID=2636767 RepID=UPI001F4C03B7|nr:energy-coupling factor transporter transmembrane protein EcfT [Mycolicibacterium sp. YH-1]UNB55261.1 energy-coupling factor transporter transmembrane protein EcfT [Mycolicibacterium sp. YH-1]